MKSNFGAGAKGERADDVVGRVVLVSIFEQRRFLFFFEISSDKLFPASATGS